MPQEAYPERLLRHALPRGKLGAGAGAAPSWLNAISRFQAVTHVAQVKPGGLAQFSHLRLKFAATQFDDRIVVLPPSEGGNVIAFGVLGDTVELRGSELKAQVRKLRETAGLNLSHVVHGLEATDNV